MRKIIFKGAGVALITPFNRGGVDYKKLEELIEFHINSGINAIIVCGSTGEASTLTDDEHKAVIKFTVEKNNGRLPIIAGVGSNCTENAIKLSKYAESIGVDGLLSVTPYYNKPSQQGLYEHFKKIAENIHIPMILYNVPSRTNIDISLETIYKLSKIENIIGIKECDFSQIGNIIKMCGDNFSVYSGEDSTVLPALALGAKGVISVIANIVPKDMCNLVKAFNELNLEECRKIQLKMLNLIEALFIESSPVPIKTAMNLLNMNVGECRLPLVNMLEKNKNILLKELKIYGLY